ncbi:hypothetical protein NB699_001543 [Xanthomonas sacchari]|uniref:ATP-binding protein n=1 Tax=Xanthomonas sacchari TaxID=56458 RepID=A0AA46Q8N8_9XANT|nr:ATP-binding protein [Xanthomonas sacchari]MCW0366560.1 hypothetical protein [Xanthomonas sacchari]MCW0440415.1 hypothetical protein [Xanthomonas sacchari]UYK87096.1 ATP-binding protein [Xanthomonas sacchari]
MTLDIRGGIKNTKLSSNPYVVFEELISNSIDAYLIRKNQEPSASHLLIQIEVNFSRADVLGELEEVEILCRDNGCGIGEDQLKAFLTKDTSYKDDLSIFGIGKCKGSGRIQFFHHFSNISIDSTCRQGHDFIQRKMMYAEPQKQIDGEDFQEYPGQESAIGTTVRLVRLRDAVRNGTIKGERLSSVFSAAMLKKQMLMVFLQRLIGLENYLGEFEIFFKTSHWNSTNQTSCLKKADLPKVTSEQTVKVPERDSGTGELTGEFQDFKISHYKLDAKSYDLPKNSISFCAKSTPVKDITSRYLRTRAEQNNPVDGFNHIILVESAYLDAHVNQQRDDFQNIPDEIPYEDLFINEKVSYSSIHEAIDDTISKMVVPADWRKEEIISEIAKNFGISEAMLHDTSTRVVYGDSAKAVAERVLKKYQERVIDETVEIVALKEEIAKAEPDSEEFRKKINDLSWKYTSSLKNFDMANLSQLIVRRAAIVQVLDLACGKNLAIQTSSGKARRKDERLIHSIFFPMRKDSNECADHDIWLLSEEYHYYDYISSDVPLANIRWENGEKLFESDIDESFRELLAKRSSDNSGKRPDIALFNKEGSAIILEFKAPGVSMDEHIGDLAEYSHLLAAKSGGRLKKFYGYLIGDTVNPLRLTQWTPFPLGKGWFQSSPLIDPLTRQPLGETYFEILHFSDVIERAKKRIGVYQNKLNIKIYTP